MKAQKAIAAQQSGVDLRGSRGETGAPPVAGGACLVGPPLAAARLLWLVVVVLSVALFVVGMGAHLSNLTSQFPGRIPADLSTNAAGQVLLSPWPDGPLLRAGVLKGDILLAVDGVPIVSEQGRPVAVDLLSKPVGTRLTVAVRTGKAPPREYTITLGGETARAVGPLGISGDFVATYSLAAEIAFASVFVGIAGLLFVRRSDDWLALLSSGALVMLFVGASSPVLAVYGTQPSLHPLLDAWFALALVTLTVFFYLFPTGRLIPRWTRLLAVVLVAAMLLAIEVPSLYPWRMLPWADFVVMFGCLGTAVL